MNISAEKREMFRQAGEAEKRRSMWGVAQALGLTEDGACDSGGRVSDLERLGVTCSDEFLDFVAALVMRLEEAASECEEEMFLSPRSQWAEDRAGGVAQALGLTEDGACDSGEDRTEH